MIELDLGSLLWPDSVHRRQPQIGVSLRSKYTSAVAFLGPHRVGEPQTLPQSTVANPGIYAGEFVVNAFPASPNMVLLGAAAGSHIFVTRIMVVEQAGFFYFADAGGLSLAFTPYHGSFGYRAIIYDGEVRDSGSVLPVGKFATVVVRFSPGQTAFFIDGVNTAVSGRNVSNNSWHYSNSIGFGGEAPKMSLLAWVPGEFTDAECIRISEDPYSELFKSLPIDFAFPAGALSLTGLTMSGFTATGATATLGITR